jgi:hypothetical protein
MYINNTINYEKKERSEDKLLPTFVQINYEHRMEISKFL